LFDDSVGKWLGNNGNKYEGEWKDDKKHRSCKKELLIYDLLILVLIDDLLGKLF